MNIKPDKPGRYVYGTILFATIAVMIVATSRVWIEQQKLLAGDLRATELRCLSENVFWESRGEELVGQYAVAEVTMNRMRSSEFPNSVCGVVHQRGAFSWTYRTELPEPHGYEWRRAKAVAESVYDNIESPLDNGALFYQAIRGSPAWAATRQQVALDGQHLFYL
jgi:spore germination cell wall hydrolase CwlJ-like protein